MASAQPTRRPAHPGPHADTGRSADASARYHPRIARAATGSRTFSLRGGVASAVRNAGLPYGYTLTVWSTAQTTIAAHGTPPVGDIALFGFGAVTTYWLLRVATAGTPSGDEGTPAGGHVALRGWVLQCIAVGLPVGATALVARVLPQTVCWPLAGIVTVLGYLGVRGSDTRSPRAASTTDT
jgi:hypothetical protein